MFLVEAKIWSVPYNTLRQPSSLLVEVTCSSLFFTISGALQESYFTTTESGLHLQEVWWCSCWLFDLADQGPDNLYTPINHDDPSTPNAPISISTDTFSPSPNNTSTTGSSERTRRRRRSRDEIQDQATLVLARTTQRDRGSSRAGGLEEVQTRGIIAELGQSGEDEEENGPPPSKRQRLMPGNMIQNIDEPLSENRRSNGTLSKKLNLSANGHTHNYGRAGSHSNGFENSSRSSFYGHDRQEVTRLIIQGLRDLGYDESASTLVRESGFELESPAVAAFRQSVLDGEWAEAESLLFGPSGVPNGNSRLTNGHSYHRGFPLAEGFNEFDLRFQLRRQKYLELLEARDHAGALMVLRQELTPLHQDTFQLHNLSGLMVCPSAEDLRTQAVWDGAQGSSRHALLMQLSKAISASVMIPNHRLATLLTQVKQYQVSKCHYHSPLSQLSLFTDHACDRDQFPLKMIQELSLKDQVWYLRFSNDGKLLAVAGQMLQVTIFDTHTWKPALTLTGHRDFVAFLAWSPDDTRLVTCSNDRTAKVWSSRTGIVMHTIDNHNEPITAAAWTPDGHYIITGSMDNKDSIHQWTENAALDHTWSANYRVNALAISPDGNRLIALSTDKQIHVYNFHTRAEQISMKLNLQPTCISISQDSNSMLINMAGHELQLIDIQSAEIVERFIGQKQTTYMIRSTFGGSEESLVLTGSEGKSSYML